MKKEHEDRILQEKRIRIQQENEGNREGIRSRLRRRIMEELTESRNMDDEQLLERIDTAIRDMGQGIYLPLKERIWLRGSLFDSFRRLDILQELVDDKTVSEIMVNGAGKIFTDIPISSKFLSPRTNSTTVIWLWISAVWIK